jgi:hypothetical protein
MFLRGTERKKNGKIHTYWSIVENKRCAGDKIVQRHVFYLGEINDQQQSCWKKTIEIFEHGETRARTVALFPEDRAVELDDKDIVRIKLSGMELRHPRQWGACWLACHLYQELRLDQFWAERLPPSRKGTRWDLVLQTLCAYRLIDPGSEWRLHRQWFEQSALGDLLGADFAQLAESHKLYECHDLLWAHKGALFDHLTARWKDLFNAQFDVLLYDLTSTYFESDPPFPEKDKRKFGYSRDKRSDCVQVVIALIVTPEGFPAWRLVKVQLPTRKKKFQFTLRRDKLREVRRREGRYLLRTNMTDRPAVQLWEFYMQLGQVEGAFKHLKGDLALRPIYHQKEARIEAHILVAFLAYALHVSLGRRLKDLAPGLTPRSVLEKLAAMQMMDVVLPTTDGREVILTRYTQPEIDQRILLEKLKLQLPEQPPPKITAPAALPK